VLNSVVAPFELLVFAVTLCRHRDRDLYHGLLASANLLFGGCQRRFASIHRKAQAKFQIRRVFMKYEAIIYEKHGAVARVITNRPQYKNAQSRLMIEEMDHAFAAANADEDVRVIILAAAGDMFSSGHDIGTREEKGHAAASFSEGRPR
jgi:Enoyl-CoA hydratase/isomerase